jgi:hypothetical protein
MSREEAIDNKNKYYTIHDGTFRVQVPANHPEAVAREWETKDGKSGTKYERHVKALFGKVTGVAIHEGDYGKNLNIYLDENDDGEVPCITSGVSSRYGEDLLKKLPALTDQEYRFMPFDFVDKENADKRIRGVAVTSKDAEEKFTVKVGNFFYDGEKNVNGYPDPTDEDKSDWEFYFKKANKFLVKYAEENVVPKYAKVEAPIEYPAEVINPEDIPF